MEQSKKSMIALEVDPAVKRWLERKAAERLIEGRAFGERSVGAVIRDLIAEAIQAEEEAVAA